MRGIAVLGVIFYHSGFSFISGGFIGVDIFFVISGYLITGIILDNLRERVFSIIIFWERRLRRLMPMLIFVLILTYIFGFILLDTNNFSALIESLIASLFSLSNLYFYFKRDYFSSDSSLVPLLHTWSLGIEQQFYFIYPIIIVLIWKYFKKKEHFVLLLLLILFLLLSLFTARINSQANFYLLPFRAWELLLGSTLFLYKEKFTSQRFKRRELFSFLGLISMVLPFFLYKNLVDDYGFQMNTVRILSLMGLSILLLNFQNGFIISIVLKNNYLNKIGVTSYSSYLLHQPVFAFVKNLIRQELTHMHSFLLIILIFLISTFTYRYIEKPFRNKNFLTLRQIYALTFISIVFVTLISYQSLKIIKYQDFPSKEFIVASELVRSNKNVYFDNLNERLFVKELIRSENRNIKNIIVGSSRIMQVANVKERQDTLNLGVSGASLQDLITIVDLSVSELSPDTIIVGLDPWILNANSSQFRYLSLKNDYDIARTRLNLNEDHNLTLEGRISNPISPIKKPLGFEIFTYAYRRINLVSNKSFISENTNPEIISKKRRNGVHVYGLSYINNTENLKKDFVLSNYGYSMQDFEYSDKLANELNIFLEHHAINHKVIIILTPYLFIDGADSNSSFKLIKEIEEYYKAVALKLNIQIIGSFDSRFNRCVAIDFYDGMHPKESCFSKLKIDFS